TSGLSNALRRLVSVWRAGFPHSHFPVPGTARRSSIPGSWIRGACVVAGRGSAPRVERTGGGAPPTSRGAKRPRLVHGTWVVQVWSRGSRAPLRGVGASRLRLRRRCVARRGGSVTRSGIGTLEQRIRFAQRTVHGRSRLTGIARYAARSASSEHGVRALPAGSDDLTKHAGSTTSAAEPVSAGVDSKT